jgi:Kef-type K+ transport system membrane component KefB
MLSVGAQFGVGLYMFLVGLEFRKNLFRESIKSAVVVSLSGMLVPFALGALLALWLVKVPNLFSPSASTLEAMLFLGAAMAITAFPMLARIIYERGLTGTALGTLALAAGAIDDAAAWCVLAIVLASFGGGPLLALKAIGGGIACAAFMTTLAPRLLAPLNARVEREGGLSQSVLAIVLMLFLLTAWAMDAIGIHAVFGGFMLGVAMPRGALTRELQRQVEPLTVVLLLPMFFTFSGLNTRLDMVNSPQMLGIALAALLAACLGKGVACWAAARATGQDPRTAKAVGALMNARGLMELIILNIGLQNGLIQPGLFAVMVLMAIVTTLMATPLFERVYGRHVALAGCGR